MKSNQVRQYTVRNLPHRLDQVLRKKTRETGKSLNEVVVEALQRGIGLAGESVVHHDLDGLIGSWNEDPDLEKALKLQDQVDPDLWS